MITLLGYSIAYCCTGYLIFLKWTRMSAPREGQFEHCRNRGFPFKGWYVPALIRSREVYGRDRGMYLQHVLWMSITAWPIVFIGGIVLVISKIVVAGFDGILNHIGNLSHFLAHFTLPPKKLEEPKDLEMIKAEREVEEICR